MPASEPSEVTAAEEEHEAEAPGSDGAAAAVASGPRPQPVRRPIDAPRWLRDACFDLGRAITVDWHARGAGDAACAALADACDGGRGLAQCVRIDLSANGVTDAGLGELIAAGREGGLRHVVRLDLSHNRLTDAGVCSLADALADGCFRNLCDLRLGGNGFGDPALEQLALALYSPTLQAPIRELNIWRHRGTTAGRQALEAAAAALEAPAQVKPPIAFYLTVAFPSGDKSIGVPASPLDVLEELLSSCLRCAQCRGPDDATRDAIDEVHAKFLQWQERWTFTIDLTPQHTAAAGSQARMSQPGSVKRVK